MAIASGLVSTASTRLGVRIFIKNWVECVEAGHVGPLEEVLADYWRLQLGTSSTNHYILDTSTGAYIRFT